MTFKFHTLGCKVNQYETEAMEEILISNGYEEARSDDLADLHVINTCSVTHMAESKSRQLIRRMRRRNPEAVIAVVGCYSQLSPEQISEISGVDIVLGTKGRSELPKLIEDFKKNMKQIILTADLKEERDFDELSITTELSNTRASIKIQEGCDMFCSYCIIPYARGHIASRKAESVIEEVKNLAGAGFKEIILTGIHVASYAKEKGFPKYCNLDKGYYSAKSGPNEEYLIQNKEISDLIDLIEILAKIEGIERLRISSIEPRWVNLDKLRRLKACGKFCPHFHLSLQSGSDRVLYLMNRKYDSKIYQDKVREIRSIFPDAGITTDLIVGFPGEGEEEFKESLEFCRRMNFSRIHIFQYSSRPGTPAALFKDQVDPQTKKQRAAIMADLEAEMRHDFMEKHIGAVLPVLIEEGSEDSIAAGYTENYMRVKLSGLFDQISGEAENLSYLNKICRVKLIRIDGDELIGDPVRDL